MEIQVRRDGVWVPMRQLAARMTPAHVRSMLRGLTCTEKPQQGRSQRFVSQRKLRAYQEAGGELRVPIGRLEPLLSLGRCRVAPREPTEVPPARLERGPQALELYDYQQDVVAQLDRDMAGRVEAAGCCSRYLQMDTGAGKTLVGTELAARRGQRTLVIVPSLAIAEQWLEEMESRTPEARRCLYRNARPVDPQTVEFMVVIINTAHKLPQTFFEKFGFVILDEAHEYVSDKYHTVLWHIQSIRQQLGLTATPSERADGMDVYASLMLGKPRSLTEITAFKPPQFKGAVRIVHYEAAAEYTEPQVGPQGTKSAILTIANICKDAYRVQLVVEEILRLALMHQRASPPELEAAGLGGGRRHGVLVFAEHRGYLDILQAALARAAPALAGDVLNEPRFEEQAAVSLLRGGAKAGALSEARDRGAHIVLTTYGYCRRGVSLKDMTAMVLASPRRNGGRQITGRILRQGSDLGIVRQIVDVVDQAMAGQLADRRKVYRSRGFSISDARVKAPPVQPAAPADIAAGLEGLTLEDLLELAEGD